jgi:two-component system, OmpR family, sensor histidine kinase MtrB
MLKRGELLGFTEQPRSKPGLAGGAQAFALLAERCSDRLGDSAAVLAAIRETSEELVGGPALCLRLLPQTRELVPDSGADRDVLADPGPIALDEWPALAAALEGLRAATVPEPPAAIRLRSPVAVPLLAGEQRLGVLLAEAAYGRELDEAKGELLSSLGAVGGALLRGALEQERTRRLSDLKGQFISLAAHELRAPFAVMHGIIKTLNARTDLPVDQAASLRTALVEQSDRTAHLVDQLLDLSRLDASSICIERASFPIRRRVQDLVRMVAGDRASEVAVQVPDDLEVVADPAAFDRIVSNLVVNALSHGRAPVTVTARQRDTHFRLTVEDRGHGVESSFVPRLFDRFARSGKTEDGNGSGLGLSIAQSYAQAHGGELIYSHADPHGARFELVLPRPAHEATERSAASTSPA